MRKIYKKTREIDLQKQIVEWLNLCGHYVWRTNAGGMLMRGSNGKTYMIRAGARGQADIQGVLLNGSFVAIEVKVGRNKPSPEQERFLEEIKRRGGVAFVAYSLDEVINKINRELI